jgi:hypothetical protein
MPTEVENALELRLALKKYIPDLSKETQKEMANALRPVVKLGLEVLYRQTQNC